METYLIALLAASAVALFTYSLIKKLRKSLVAKMTRSNDQIKSLKTQIQKIAEKQKNTAEQLSIINKAVHATQPHSKMRLFTILSMPKCGGSSVKSTLLHSFPDAEIMHLHVYSLKTIQQIAEFAGRTAYPLALERLSLHVARASAARTLMKILYAARMARYDLLRPTCYLATKRTKWSARCGRALHRLVCYINSSLDVKEIGVVLQSSL
jgi:hypothetical protein